MPATSATAAAGARRTSHPRGEESSPDRVGHQDVRWLVAELDDPGADEGDDAVVLELDRRDFADAWQLVEAAVLEIFAGAVRACPYAAEAAAYATTHSGSRDRAFPFGTASSQFRSRLHCSELDFLPPHRGGVGTDIGWNIGIALVMFAVLAWSRRSWRFGPINGIRREKH